jgi:hypothetical protein
MGNYKLEKYWAEKRKVQLAANGQSGWFTLMNHIDDKYVIPHVGKEVSATIQGEQVSFIKPIQSSQPNPNNGFKKEFKPGNSYKPKEDVDWDKIALGKVRHGVAIEAIKKDMPLNDETKKWIESWTDYIVNGSKSEEPEHIVPDEDYL